MRESKNRFFVKFRGVRGSYSRPGADFLKYGGNTLCVEINVNGHLIILDAGSGITDLGDELMAEYLSSSLEHNKREAIKATILLTHIHQDHIQGLTFFKPIHLKTSDINVIGYSNFKEPLSYCLSELLFSKSFPLDLEEVASELNIIDIKDKDIIIFEENEHTPTVKKYTSEKDAIPQGEQVIVSCYKCKQHPKNGVMVYKIAYKDKSVVIATDKEDYIGADKRLALFSRNTDLLIHDAQYTTEDYLCLSSPKQGFGHSTFDMAFEAMKQSHAKKLAFIHFDPSYNDEKLTMLENYYSNLSEGCFMAKENEEIVIL